MANPMYETNDSGGMFSDYYDADYESQSSTKSRERKEDKEREKERQRSNAMERDRVRDREAERRSKIKERERDRDNDRERNKHDRPHRYRCRDYTEKRHSERSRDREKKHNERSRDREMRQRSLSRYRYEGSFRSPSERYIENRYRGEDRNRERRHRSSSDRSASPYRRFKDRGRNHITSEIVVPTIDRAVELVDRKKNGECEERERRNGKERDRERDSENEYDFGLLRDFIEIFSITVFTDCPCHLYGTIEADIECIFNEKAHCSSNLKKITSPFNGFPFSHVIANLAGPERAIEAYDRFTIELNLMSDDSPLINKEVIKGRMCWDPCDNIKYNQRIRGVVDGKYGKAIINYAVLEYAVEAHVEVTIFHGHKQLVVSEISALNSCMRNQKVILYGQRQCEAVVPLQRIPLSRSTVVVPSDGTLTIEFHLAMFDECGRMSAVEEEVVFEAERCGKVEKRIQKDYGEIGVSITWLSY